MIEEAVGPIVLSKKEIDIRVDGIDNQIQEGNFLGSGEFRYGIRGDIENLMGWHGKHGPEISLSQQERVAYLDKFAGSAGDLESGEERDVFSEWLGERVREIKKSEAERILMDESYGENDSIVLAKERLRGIKSELEEINSRGVEESHPMRSEIHLSQEDSESATELFSKKDEVMISLYDSVFE